MQLGTATLADSYKSSETVHTLLDNAAENAVFAFQRFGSSVHQHIKVPGRLARDDRLDGGPRANGIYGQFL
jgi:hypothetical protein